MKAKATKTTRCTNLADFAEWLEATSKGGIEITFQSLAENHVSECEDEAVELSDDNEAGEWEPVAEVGKKLYYSYEMNSIHTKSGNPETFDIEWEVVAI